VRIVGEVFLRRKATSHFSDGKIDWRKVENKVHVADNMCETVLFVTFVGSLCCVSFLQGNIRRAFKKSRILSVLLLKIT
jgi:hypothetical protein